MMNWEAISAIGQITSALAVVLTLGYLGIQVRATREVAADTNRLHRSNGVRDIMLASISNTEIRQALEQALCTRCFLKSLEYPQMKPLSCIGQCQRGSGYTGDSMRQRLLKRTSKSLRALWNYFTTILAFNWCGTIVHSLSLHLRTNLSILLKG